MDGSDGYVTVGSDGYILLNCIPNGWNDKFYVMDILTKILKKCIL